MPQHRARPLGILGVVLAVLFVLVPHSAIAQGGPPLITDDPDTPGPGYWEVNISEFVEKAHRRRTIESPRVDANYGVGDTIQLKFEVPWLAVNAPGEAIQHGPGNSVVGLKWRFLGEEGKRIAWAIYPQFEFNTGHSAVDKSLVEDGHSFLLPTEITLEMAHAEVNIEVGRNFVSNGNNGWIYGLSTEGHVHPRLELLAELHGERQGTNPTELIVNVGGREKLARKLLLMIAAGRAIHGDPDEEPNLIFYCGLQLNLPEQYKFGQKAGPVPTRPRRGSRP